MLTKSLDRLAETIEQENAALLARDLTALSEFNRRKSQSLLEITRLIRSTNEESLAGELTQRFAELREKLEINQDILARYMRAAQEVSEIISGAIHSANSDGTYSAPLTHAGASA